MPEQPSPPDWKAEVIQHATTSGIDLPSGTIDELALHLEDMYSAARREGVDEQAARGRTLRTLAETPWSALRAHVSHDPRLPFARNADDIARAASGSSLSLTSALRTLIIARCPR